MVICSYKNNRITCEIKELFKIGYKRKAPILTLPTYKYISRKMWKIADTIPKDQHHNWKLKWRYKFEAYGHSNRAFTRWWWGPDGPCSRDREPKSTRKLGTPPMTDKKLLLRPQTAMDSAPTLTLTECWPPFCFLFNARLFNVLTETHFMNKRLADFERKIPKQKFVMSSYHWK